MLRFRPVSRVLALGLTAALALPLSASVMLAPARAEATVVVPLSREQLVEWSDVVVRATVVEQRSLWNERHTQIVTHSVLHVREYLKGQGAETLTLVTSGGVVGNVESRVDGEARFEAGQDVVLFAQRAGDDFVTLTALAQSLYVVEHTPGQEPVARRDLSQLSFARPGVATSGGLVAAPVDPRETFAHLASSVRTLAARRAR